MDIKTVDSYFEKYLQALEECQSEIEEADNNFGNILAKMIPEVLSRLCCKCSFDSKDKLINFLLKLYS